MAKLAENFQKLQPIFAPFLKFPNLNFPFFEPALSSIKVSQTWRKPCLSMAFHHGGSDCRGSMECLFCAHFTFFMLILAIKYFWQISYFTLHLFCVCFCVYFAVSWLAPKLFRGNSRGGGAVPGVCRMDAATRSTPIHSHLFAGAGAPSCLYFPGQHHRHPPTASCRRCLKAPLFSFKIEPF